MPVRENAINFFMLLILIWLKDHEMAIQKNRKNQQACIVSDDLQQLLDELPGVHVVG